MADSEASKAAREAPEADIEMEDIGGALTFLRGVEDELHEHHLQCLLSSVDDGRSIGAMRNVERN